MSDVNEPRDTNELPEDALSAYLDGELAPDARAAVEARLEASPEWRAILADVSVARDAVRALPTAAPPEGFWERVRAGVTDEVVVDLEKARAKRRSPSRWIAALGSAAAAAVVIAVVVTPTAERVRPSVATLSNAHAVRSSGSQDPVGSLAPVGKVSGFQK